MYFKENISSDTLQTLTEQEKNMNEILKIMDLFQIFPKLACENHV